MQYENRKVSDLIPYARNARTHSPEQIAKLAGSIKEFGFINPVIISNDGGILAGHGRVMAAQKLGMDEVPCVIESHLTDTQKRAYILADNRLALDAGWDEQMLAIEIEELNAEDFDIDLLGFDDDELSKMLDETPIEVTSEEEATESIDEDAPTITVDGDLWILGDHRLICGDSRNPDIIDRLFSEQKPNLMVTDPPYGVNYSYAQKAVPGRALSKRQGKVLNDDNPDWTETFSLFPGEIAYVWHAGLFTDVVLKSLRDCGFTVNQIIIWNKSEFTLGHSDYQWKHEPCAYATKGKHNWKGGRNQSTVWDIPIIYNTKEGAFGHSTQKPIDCMKRPIKNNSDVGDYVYDPFCGSGTTIIAAEQIGRKCLAVELSPQYCDIIIRRWERETGRKAVRAPDGALFDDLDGQNAD